MLAGVHEHAVRAGGQRPQPWSTPLQPLPHPFSPQGCHQARLSLQRLNDLLCGRRGVTVDTALRLARVLGTSAQFWINLQDARELWDALHGPNAKEIEKLEPLQHDRDGRLVVSA